jgi:hypothetical protein
MQTLGYNPAIGLNDLVTPFIQPLKPLALQALELLHRVIVVKNRLFRVHRTVNLRIERHNVQETVSASAYTRLLHLFFVGFLALEHAPELKLLIDVFFELGLPAGLTGHLLATGVLNGLPVLLVETLETPVTCDVLELLHPVTR